MKTLAYASLLVWLAVAYFLLYPVEQEKDEVKLPPLKHRQIPALPVEEITDLPFEIEDTVPTRRYRKEFVDFIKNSEGFKSKRYICAGGKSTIGYGFTADGIEEAKRYNLIPKDYVLPTLMDRETATELLESVILPSVERIVDKNIRVSLTEGQREALISFTYNCGEKHLKTLAVALNAKNYKIDEKIKSYVFAKKKKLRGLVIRRNDELAMWNRVDSTNSLANNE